jgi:cytoskeleton protein RodZ
MALQASVCKPKWHKKIVAVALSVSGFGEKLRRQREMRGVSLEEISATTKIGTRSLQAIEEEDFEKLPGGIFNKGFVRAYARYLGLDEEQTVTDFDLVWNQYEVSRAPAPLPVSEEQENSRRFGSVWVLILVLLALSLVSAGWYERQHSRTIENSSEASSAISPVQSPPPSQASTDQNSGSGKSESAMQNSASTTPQISSPSPVPAPKSSKPTTAGATPSVPASEPSLTAASSPIQLRVFAREDSWLSISADGKDLGQGILGAQKSRSIRAQKEVRIKVGNAGGIEISFNGEPVPLNGESKEVKQLVFTPSGWQR